MGGEKTSLSRERSRKMRGKLRFTLKYEPGKSRQIEVSRGVEIGVEQKGVDR